MLLKVTVGPLNVIWVGASLKGLGGFRMQFPQQPQGHGHADEHPCLLCGEDRVRGGQQLTQAPVTQGQASEDMGTPSTPHSATGVPTLNLTIVISPFFQMHLQPSWPFLHGSNTTGCYQGPFL